MARQHSQQLLRMSKAIASEACDSDDIRSSGADARRFAICASQILLETRDSSLKRGESCLSIMLRGHYESNSVQAFTHSLSEEVVFVGMASGGTRLSHKRWV